MRIHYRRYLILLLFACMATSAYAQKKDYYRGYIIQTEGDTLEGWVKDRSSGTFPDLYARIHFRADKARGKRKYGPRDILAYNVYGQLFESVPVYEESEFFRFRYPVGEGYERVFLKVIERNGDLTYYHWEYIDGDSNSIDYIPMFYREGFHEMVRVTQGFLGLKRNKLTAYFSDCPDLVHAIEAKQVKDINEVYNFYVDHCVNARQAR